MNAIPDRDGRPRRRGAPDAARAAIGIGLFAALLLASCNEPDDTKHVTPGTPVLLVVNSIGETLDRVDLVTGRVQHDVLTLGNAPNDVAVDASRNVFYVANSLDNEVWEVPLSTFAPGTVFDLGANSSPYALETLSDGRVAVTNWVAGDVAWLDPGTGGVAHREAVGRGPEALLEAGGRLFVTTVDLDVPSGAYGIGEIVRIGGGRVAVGTNPQHLIPGPDGRIHVVCTGDYATSFGEVMVVNASTLAVEDTIALGGSPAYAIASGGDVYVSGFYGGLLKYDGTTHEVLRGLDHPVLDAAGLGNMAVDPDAHRLYVPGFEDDLVYVVDTTADTLVTAWSVGDGPVAVALARIP